MDGWLCSLNGVPACLLRAQGASQPKYHATQLAQLLMGGRLKLARQDVGRGCRTDVG